MKELLLIIAKSLVDSPEQVHVSESTLDNNIVLKLSVASEDMGKVIGKHGKVVKAIRNVIKAVSLKEDKNVTVEIVDLKS